VNNALGARCYFSNRLPIALSSGVPVVHNYESGYEEIFKPAEDFFFFKTTSEAWNMTKQLLEKDQSELDKIGLEAYKFAVNRLTATDTMRYMISVLRDHRLSKEDGKEIEIRANPWINARQL
ncbi:glycosyltransferase family 1 protein, partial [Candidatus Parcubacteria bacterium]|nr:glycosyltransferase family 1 protein [Candidatus Parcubacteria bacterium]